AERRSAFASSCSGKVSNVSTNLLRDLRRSLRPVDGDDALGEDTCEVAVRTIDERHELGALALDAVGLAFPPGGGLLGRHENEERAVGQEVPCRRQVDLEDTLDAESAGKALIGEGGVEVAIADDVGPLRLRRPNDLVDELGTRCREESCLGPGRDLFSAED